MDEILLCSNRIPPVTTIYNSFIQNDMLDANGSYVKVYLYLSMCMQSGNTAFSISSLADQMENTEKDILRALYYWEKKGLITLHINPDNKQISGIDLLMPKQTEAKIPIPKGHPEINIKQIVAIPEQTEKTDLSTDTAETKFQKETLPKAEKHSINITEEQTTRLSGNSDFIWVTQIIENFLERPLQTGEICFLMYLFDNLNFSKDLIVYLYEYCCSLGKTNLAYVQAVAFSWADEHITTPEQAQEKALNYNAVHRAVAKAFGLNRALGTIEKHYVKRWNEEWHFELPAITEACSRTLLSIQKADFKYTDSILANWHENGVHTLQDIKNYDENYKKKVMERQTPKHSYHAASKRNQFQSFEQRDVTNEDMKELEKILLSR